MFDRTQPPAYQALRSVHITHAQSQPLANGIQLHWLHAGEQPIVRVECIFKAGTWYEPQKGVSYFTIKMMNEGTLSMTSLQINEYIDQYGAFIEFNHGNDRINLTLYTLDKYIDKLLPVIKDIILHSNFPTKELDNIKNITRQNLKINSEKTSYLAQSRFKEAIFGVSHPYGKNLYTEDITLIKPEVLQAFHKEHVCNKPFDVLVSGYVTEDTLKQVRNTFENISFAVSNTSTLPLESDPIAHIREEVIDKTDSLQSSIRVGKKLFTRKHPDYFKIIVLNEVLGGYFGSRLMKNIREEKGFTYGIHSSVIALRNEGYFAIGTDVKKEFTTQTLEEIYKEIKILQTELVDEDELQTVQNYMIGSFAATLTTPFELADHYKTILFNGLTYEFYDHYIDGILQATPQDLLELANKYLDIDSLTAVVAGGKV